MSLDSSSYYTAEAIQKNSKNYPPNNLGYTTLTNEAVGTCTCPFYKYNNQNYNYYPNTYCDGSNCIYSTTNGCNLNETDSCYYNGGILDWQIGNSTYDCPGSLQQTPSCSTVDFSLCVLEPQSGQPLSITAMNTLSTICNPYYPDQPCNDTGYVGKQGEVYVGWKSNADQAIVKATGRQITCSYNKSHFTSNPDDLIKQLTNFNTNFVSQTNNGTSQNNDTITNNTQVYNQMMQDYSSVSAGFSDASCKTYAIYPYQAVTPTTCNRLVSIGSEGDYARGWSTGSQTNNVIPTAYLDNAKMTYCSNNINAPECQCINRSLVDSNYDSLQSVIGLPPACWYIPCQDGTNYLITSDISGVQCSPNICENINANFAATGGTITPDEQDTVSCTVDSSDQTNKKDTNNTTTTTNNFVSFVTNHVWLFLLIGLGGVILIGVVIFLIVKKKK